MTKTKEQTTTCGDCGKWSSAHNIILCGACHEIMRNDYHKEERLRILEIIDEVYNAVKKDMQNPKVKRTDIGIADGFAHLLKARIHLAKINSQQEQDNVLSDNKTLNLNPVDTRKGIGGKK